MVTITVLPWTESMLGMMCFGRKIPITTPTAVRTSQTMKTLPPGREKNGAPFTGGASASASGGGGESDDTKEPRHVPEGRHRTAESYDARPAWELAIPCIDPCAP